jgi:UDPglucose--hexose-1-phosphate uridylyltransferase
MGLQDAAEQSEFRQDGVSGGWVIFAPERARRPLGQSKPQPRQNIVRDVCPFCPGPGHDTPPPTFVLSAPDGPWQVLVCPNKFPAVRAITPDTHGLTLRIQKNQLPGFGVHELVIEGQDHFTDPTELTDEVYQKVLITYRERIRTFAADQRMDYVTVFKNVGAEAGASMAHTHSQIMATPFIPNNIRDELSGAEDYFKRRNSCIFCDMVQPEASQKTRFVAETANFVAICPFAPRFAYEMWILPKAHTSHFETITDAETRELVWLLKRVLQALDAVAGVPAYNYFLHTAPLRTDPSPSYHWHIEIVPRTTRPAGFEWSTGVFINTVMPERAAKELRKAVGK